MKQDFNISIKSELLAGIRKEDVASAGSSRGGSANSSSNMSKKFNLNCSHNGHFPKKKPLNSKTDCYYEEELYVKGCTAVWSKGMLVFLGLTYIYPFLSFYTFFNRPRKIEATNSTAM